MNCKSPRRGSQGFLHVDSEKETFRSAGGHSKYNQNWSSQWLHMITRDEGEQRSGLSLGLKVAVGALPRGGGEDATTEKNARLRQKIDSHMMIYVYMNKHDVALAFEFLCLQAPGRRSAIVSLFALRYFFLIAPPKRCAEEKRDSSRFSVRRSRTVGVWKSQCAHLRLRVGDWLAVLHLAVLLGDRCWCEPRCYKINNQRQSISFRRISEVVNW